MDKKWKEILVCAAAVFAVGAAALVAQLPAKKVDIPANPALARIPHINSVAHHIYGDPPPEIDLVGTNFGATKGTKNVRIDGTLVTSYILGWHDTSLSFNPPFTFIYWDHVYQFAIVDGATVLSNVLSARIPWDFDAMIPKEGPAGTEVEITVYKLCPTPNGFVLKIGSHDFPVISWTAGGTWGKIRAKVPAGLAAGVYNVNLQKGGEVASETYQFKVTPSFTHVPIPPIKK